MMAALAAWQSGWIGAMSLSRPDLAVAVARIEHSRLTRVCPDSTASDLLAHLAAFVTLCGGLESGELRAAATEECVVLQKSYAGGPGSLADALAGFLPSPGGAAAILPDIAGEAFLLLYLREGGGRRRWPPPRKPPRPTVNWPPTARTPSCRTLPARSELSAW